MQKDAKNILCNYKSDSSNHFEQATYHCYNCEKNLCFVCLNYHNNIHKNHSYELLSSIIEESTIKKKNLRALNTSINDCDFLEFGVEKFKDLKTLENNYLGKFDKIISTLRNKIIIYNDNKEAIDKEKENINQMIKKLYEDPTSIRKMIHNDISKNLMIIKETREELFEIISVTDGLLESIKKSEQKDNDNNDNDIIQEDEIELKELKIINELIEQEKNFRKVAKTPTGEINKINNKQNNNSINNNFNSGNVICDENSYDDNNINNNISNESSNINNNNDNDNNYSNTSNENFSNNNIISNNNNSNNSINEKNNNINIFPIDSMDLEEQEFNENMEENENKNKNNIFNNDRNNHISNNKKNDINCNSTINQINSHKNRDVNINNNNEIFKRQKINNDDIFKAPQNNDQSNIINNNHNLNIDHNIINNSSNKKIIMFNSYTYPNSKNKYLTLLLEYKISQKAKLEFKLFNKIQQFNYNDTCYNLNINEFPYNNSRIINLEKYALITCGITSHDDKRGNNFCYKLEYEDSKVYISQFKNCLFTHQSHSILYSKKYACIFILSGFNQEKCEFFSFYLNKWNLLNPVHKPKTNAISFLFNERYIFLIDCNDIENGECHYEVFDLKIFLEEKCYTCWYSYNFNININFEKLLFCGVILDRNNVFLVGGVKNTDTMKLTFELNNNKCQIHSVSLFDKIKKYIAKKDNIGVPFFGEQIFKEYEDFYCNDAFGYKTELVPKNIFK